MTSPKPSSENTYLAPHAALLIASFKRATGKDLIQIRSTDEASARALFEAPYGVVSHNTDADPVFNYGNQTALGVFELDWAAFTQLPSRRSAAPMNRAEREQLLSEVNRRGFMDNYRGERVSANGRRFYIEDATVWNIIDASGNHCGQAAVFYRWPDLK